MQYVIGKINAADFCNKFEDTIRNYENSSGAVPLSEEEKRDAFYNAVMVSVPSVQTIDFISKRTKGNRTSYDELKLIVMQDEAEKNQTSNTAGASGGQTQARAANFASRENTRCFECQGQGHIGRDCPHKGMGIKCYRCNQFGNHKAPDCPNAKARPDNKRGGSFRGNPRYKHSNNNSRGFGKNNRRRVAKRNFENGNTNNAKRGRYRGRGKGGFNNKQNYTDMQQTQEKSD